MEYRSDREKGEGREWVNTYRKERVIRWEGSTLLNDRNKRLMYWYMPLHSFYIIFDFEWNKVTYIDKAYVGMSRGNLINLGAVST